MAAVPGCDLWLLYLDVLVDNVLAGEPVLLVHILGVAEHAVPRIEVVVCPPEQSKV